MTAELRASDADRDRVADELRHQTGAGRLTPDEAGERIARAHNARTVADLEQLTHDLPDPVPHEASPRRTAPPLTDTATLGALVATLVLLGSGLTSMCS